MNTTQFKISKIKIPLENRVENVTIPQYLRDNYELALAYAIGFVGRNNINNIDKDILQTYKKIEEDVLKIQELAKGFEIDLGEREKKLLAFYQGIGRNRIEVPRYNSNIAKTNNHFVNDLSLTEAGLNAIMHLTSETRGNRRLSYPVENTKVCLSTDSSTTLVYAQQQSKGSIYKVNDKGIALLWDGTTNIENDQQLMNFFDMLNLAGIDLERSSGAKDFVLHRTTPEFIIHFANKAIAKKRKVSLEEFLSSKFQEEINPQYASSNLRIFNESHYNSDAGPNNQPGIDTLARKVGNYK